MSGVKGKSGGQNKTGTKYKMVSGRNKQRINKDAPEIISTDLIQYPGLKAIGKKFRDTYYEIMWNNGTWTEEYSDALHLLANAAEQWHQADKEVKKAGRKEPVYDKEGKLIGTKPSGLHKVERDLHQSYLQLLSMFGRDPRSRDDIKKIATGKSINPFAGKI